MWHSNMYSGIMQPSHMSKVYDHILLIGVVLGTLYFGSHETRLLV
jgi:hypothetical protein